MNILNEKPWLIMISSILHEQKQMRNLKYEKKIDFSSHVLLGRIYSIMCFASIWGARTGLEHSFFQNRKNIYFIIERESRCSLSSRFGKERDIERGLRFCIFSIFLSRGECERLGALYFYLAPFCFFSVF